MHHFFRSEEVIDHWYVICLLTFVEIASSNYIVRNSASSYTTVHLVAKSQNGYKLHFSFIRLQMAVSKAFVGKQLSLRCNNICKMYIDYLVNVAKWFFWSLLATYKDRLYFWVIWSLPESGLSHNQTTLAKLRLSITLIHNVSQNCIISRESSINDITASESYVSTVLKP